MGGDDSTIVITDINAALGSSDREAQKYHACFMAEGGELNGSLFELPQNQETTFGRSADNTHTIEFEGISRKHMKVSFKGAQAFLEDLGSANGTFHNNQKISGPVELKKGSVVKVGPIALRFIPKGDPERLAFEKLQKQANTDGLTNSYNKSFFLNRLDLEVRKAKTTGQPLTLIVFDLDHFKKLNDSYGHDAGDFVLKELSAIIRNNGVRADDIFARYGGEEFVILLPKTNLKQGFDIAERLRKLVEEHQFVYDQKRLPVTTSVGVADYRPGVALGADLFKRADTALYASKNGGRNKVSFFKES